MEKVWNAVETLRRNHESLRHGDLPVDVFSLVEIDLRLNVIPFDDLLRKYDVEAALRADFTGIYVDAETYVFLDTGPEWKLNRLRFSLGHEVGHFVLHRDLPQPRNFASLPDFARWTRNFDLPHEGLKYSAEQEANEFAGRLLVPVERLRDFYDEFRTQAAGLFPVLYPSLREAFASNAASKFGVNKQVIEVRLDREGIWPAQ